MLLTEPLVLNTESCALYDRFVSPNHTLRRLGEALDFSFIRDLVADRYNPWVGRPAEHPELLWRLVFAQYYLNLSDEKIILATHESLALRLFLHLNLDEAPPHPTTLQKLRAHRLREGLYLKIHFALLHQAEGHGLLHQAEGHGLLDRSERQINGKDNGILLPDNEELARELKLPAHKDGHGDWNEHVQALLDEIQRRAADEKWGQNDSRWVSAVEELDRKLRQEITDPDQNPPGEPRQ